MPGGDRTAPVSIERLATLPVFFKLNGRVAVMAGGSLPAVWKAELLAAAGATVRVFAEQPCPDMLAHAGSGRDITIIGRRWTPGDLTGVALAIGAIDDEAEAQAFREAARAAGVPVNVIDKPDYCDFQFGTLIERSPVVIGISTDGAAPVFGQALRARIEAVLPQNLRLWAEAAKAWRPLVQARDFDFRRRRRFWERFSRRALSGDDPSSDALEACFAVEQDDVAPDRGRVVLVGCGDGTPDAMTLGAVGALQSADVVVADPDLPAATLALARREATKREASSLALADVLSWTQSGQIVAWAGTGDPRSCGRWQDRRESLQHSGATTDIVPGLRSCPSCDEGRCRVRTL